MCFSDDALSAEAAVSVERIEFQGGVNQKEDVREEFCVCEQAVSLFSSPAAK